MKYSRYRVTRGFLLFWCLFIGIGAVAGSVCMLLDPTGGILQMGPLLPYFQVLPFADILFQDYVFSGISLLIVNGLTNLIATTLIIIGKKQKNQKIEEIGFILGTLFGITLVLWICIQLYLFPTNFMDTIYFIFGVIQALTGFMCWVFYRQESIVFNRSNYPSVNELSEKSSNSSTNTIVVYFSRLGRTKTFAYQEAEKLGADILELKTTEPTESTGGFWWSGRFAMHSWEMPLVPYQIDWAKYSKVVICSPIWVFQLACPIKRFMSENSCHLTEVSYILVHFMKCSYKSLINKVNRVFEINPVSVTDICTQFGKTRKIWHY